MESSTKKWIYIIFTTIMMGIIIIVGTYAWLSYRSNDTAMVLTIGEINNVQVTLSPYQIKANILPQVTYTSDKYASVNVVNKSSASKSFRLYYQINSIDNELISSNFKYTIEKSTNGTTYSVYKTGNFSSASNQSELTILEERIPGNNTTYQYKVYIWLDGTSSAQNSMQGKSFNGELNAQIAANQYQFVEYLKNTGTQYINAGFIPSENFEYEIKYMDTSASGSNYVMGSRNGSSGTLYQGIGGAVATLTMSIHRHSTQTPSNYRTKNNIYEINSSYNSSMTGISTIKCLTTGETFTGTQTGTSLGATANYLVFAVTSGQVHKGMALYKLKIYDNNILIRDFIPAYRKSDGARGLYDAANDEFYTNVGTGTFAIGPEV